MPVTAGGITFSGFYAATTTPLRDDGQVDYDEFAKHCAWLADEGVAGLVPNGSLGEYEALSDARTAVRAAAGATSEAGA